MSRPGRSGALGSLPTISVRWLSPLLIPYLLSSTAWGIRTCGRLAFSDIGVVFPVGCRHSVLKCPASPQPLQTTEAFCSCFHCRQGFLKVSLGSSNFLTNMCSISITFVHVISKLVADATIVLTSCWTFGMTNSWSELSPLIDWITCARALVQ